MLLFLVAAAAVAGAQVRYDPDAVKLNNRDPLSPD
jgi:hypothetical protein